MSASGYSSDPRSEGVEVLDVDECWRLLRLGSVGRLAVNGADGGLDVLPINYLTHERHVYFRTAPGGKLESIQANPEVAFETDGQDEKRRWSVVIRGTAYRLTNQAEIDESGIKWLISWSPIPKDNFVRIDPRTVSGRRFPKSYRATALGSRAEDGPAPENEAQEFTSQDGVLPKPWPIPHRPPVTPEA